MSMVPTGEKIANDPLAELVYMFESAYIHKCVGTPQHAPLQLFQFGFNIASNFAFSNVQIDFDLNVNICPKIRDSSSG